MNRQPDFLAILTYLSTTEGGRSTPAFSGYRPQIKFPFSELQTSGQQKFVDNDVVYPGETIIAEVTIASTQFFEHKLQIGSKFEFREGDRIIGTGVILSVLNNDLLLDA